MLLDSIRALIAEQDDAKFKKAITDLVNDESLTDTQMALDIYNEGLLLTLLEKLEQPQFSQFYIKFNKLNLLVNEIVFQSYGVILQETEEAVTRLKTVLEDVTKLREENKCLKEEIALLRQNKSPVQQPSTKLTFL